MAHKEAAKHTAKKSAKKSAKKAASKKVAGNHGKHGPGQDVRRAYEHLHRLGILHPLLASETLPEVDTLSKLAHASLRNGDGEAAADLLRAAEHLAFGSPGENKPERNIGPELASAAAGEFEHLTRRAEERAAEHPGLNREVEAVYNSMLHAAKQAFQAGALYRSLELARGAEALTHADVPRTDRLPAPRQHHKLKL